jgi:hypothetical protein
MMSLRSICWPKRLTAILPRYSTASRQPCSFAQALCNAHSPTGSIRPRSPNPLQIARTMAPYGLCSMRVGAAISTTALKVTNFSSAVT